MSEVDLSPVLDDPRRVTRLFTLAKKWRGVESDALVFVGMHNVAQHWWCTQQAVFKSRENEKQIFAACLEDRLKLAVKLELMKKLPRGDGAVLDAVRALTFSDAETRFKKDHQRSSALNKSRSRKLGVARGRASVASDPDESAFERGIRLEAIAAEHYPTFRWHFPWKDYVIVGVPDGISSQFVYEF